ncbi:ABC transporter ATP-binding protein [Thermotoga sp. Mc24]|uniref:ABC transporter ATP-binding protein n=1 Tax=Thermotoga sp. Mc24 TaxID=1231241 RepID=UPI0022868954|nr:ABC transporter ATP-binding protein [Thermotoga sp. Mc24]
MEGVSFSLEKGKSLGIVGQNSAGKTTLLKILATILKPDEGRLFLFEKDALKDLSYIRKRIAFVPEFPALLEELTVRENLLFFSRLRGVEMESFIVSELMLEPFMGTLVRNASKGVKQRTALAVALSGNPELLILDEPTSGLDVESASIVRSKLKRLKEEGITVIISSHIREDIEELCDEILVINGENRGDSFERDR